MRGLVLAPGFDKRRHEIAHAAHQPLLDAEANGQQIAFRVLAIDPREITDRSAGYIDAVGGW